MRGIIEPCSEATQLRVAPLTDVQPRTIRRAPRRTQTQLVLGRAFPFISVAAQEVGADVGLAPTGRARTVHVRVNDRVRRTTIAHGDAQSFTRHPNNGCDSCVTQIAIEKRCKFTTAPATRAIMRGDHVERPSGQPDLTSRNERVGSLADEVPTATGFVKFPPRLICIMPRWNEQSPE